jgi:hypothetical protein
VNPIRLSLKNSGAVTERLDRKAWPDQAKSYDDDDDVSRQSAVSFN